MVCKNCQGPLASDDRFCKCCGMPVATQMEAPMPPVAPPYYPETVSYPTEQSVLLSAGESIKPAKLPKLPDFSKLPKLPANFGRSPLLIGAAAAVVVILVLVLLLGGNPRGKVVSALSSTLGEFEKVAKLTSVTELSKIAEKKNLSHDADIAIASVNQEALHTGAFQGLGMTVKADVNLDKHEMGFQVVPYYGSVEILNASAAMREEMIYFSLPQILSDAYYGISTKTLMQDLRDLGVPVDESETISFNLFELIDLVQKEIDAASKDAKADMDQALKDLANSIQVEKKGSESIPINGTKTNCTLYGVVLPQAALEACVKAMESSANAIDRADLMERVLEAVGLSGDAIDSILYGMSGAAAEADFSELYDLLEELGDIELDVYVSGGKVSAVLCELESYGNELGVALYIGGREKYVDDITFELTFDGETLSLKSSGDHTGKSGTFTDKTVLTGPYGDEFILRTELVTEGDNAGGLTFSLKEAGETILDLKGNYQAKNGRMTLELEEVNLYSTYYGKVMTLSVSYTVSEYQRRVQESNVQLLSKMTEDDLVEIVGNIEENVQSWLSGLMQQVPELGGLI